MWCIPVAVLLVLGALVGAVLRVAHEIRAFRLLIETDMVQRETQAKWA